MRTRELVFEQVPESERHNHKAVLDELEDSKKELEDEIAALKKQLA